VIVEPEVVDLFCGIGGLSAGFRNEGFKVIAGIDSDPSCQYAYETNVEAKFIPCDIASVSGTELNKLYSKKAKRILVGCAPCQPFSLYTGRYRRNSTEERPDKRWQLLHEFTRLIEEVRPDVISMENVPRVVLHPVFTGFVERLRAGGYFVTYHKVRADHYGVPQRRTRLVLFASKLGPVELIDATHRERPRSVRDAIGFLPPISAGGADSDDRLHASRGIGSRNMQRLRATSEGGSWKDWDDDLKLACHKKAGGKSFRAVYGRMKWNEPSPVITTQCLGIGNGRFGHPDQDRAISIREAALLQSFPADFKFVAPGTKISGVRLARQIGNAVPVLLAEAVARSIRRHLNGNEAILANS
jgi:DNA (cytosine-5)-methyltransferase 1